MNWEIVLKVLEGTSYACAVLVVVIAYKGLKQIKVGLEQIQTTKKSIRLESKRDALRCAN